MPSKTPRFDAALDPILAELKPHTRTCEETGEQFEITEKDIEMMKLLRVPPPTTAWWARIRQKRHFMAGFDLFRRTAQDGKSVVTMYDPGSFAPILHPTDWQNDAFDAMVYGAPVDPGRSFFAQWQALSRAVPRPAVIQDPKSVNSEWSVYNWAMKDCYCTYEGLEDEDLQYADIMGWSKHAADAYSCNFSEWCYETVDCTRCARVVFSERCEDSTDLAFSAGCKNCADCFGCTNLRNKKFCFLNQQLTEEEYRKRRGAIDLSDGHVVAEWQEKMRPVWDRAYRRASFVTRSEDVHGDDIHDSRDVDGIMLYSGQRMRRSFGCTSCTDMLDVTSCVRAERCANVLKVFDSAEVRNALHCTNCIDVEYSELLTNCEHCFGCIGLKRKKFCIFNVQYTEEEYWPLVDAVKTAMLERGEYGEFFPHAASPFAYNASGISTLYPFTKQDADRVRARWYDFVEPEATSTPLVDALPTRLDDATDEMLRMRFRCPETGRPFGFVAPEVALHRTLDVALPRVHPTVRRLRRVVAYLPPRLHERSCAFCGILLETRVPSTYPSPILCGACYEAVALGEKLLSTKT